MKFRTTPEASATSARRPDSAADLDTVDAVPLADAPTVDGARLTEVEK